jgi:hypothetical protein
MGIIVLIVAISGILCFGLWYFTQRLPTWLRLLTTTLLAALLFAPVIIGGEGGVGIGPLVLFLPFGLGHGDFDSQLVTAPVVISVLSTWMLAYCFSMLVVGIRHIIKKRNANHDTSHDGS